MKESTVATSTVTLGELVDRTGAFSPQTELLVEHVAATASDAAEVAFVVPVHDQAAIIGDVLESIAGSATSRWELAVILDDYTDGSVEVVRDWARRTAHPHAGITMVTAENALFETLADSVGIASTTAPLIIEVQADMIIEEVGFDRHLAAPFARWDDVFAVSARAAHSFSTLFRGRRPGRARLQRIAAAGLARVLARRKVYTPTRLEHLLTSQIGRCADLIELPSDPGAPKRLYLHDTVVRGPLAIRRDRFEELGGFDTERFFLGDDDHDLMLRAGRAGHVVGYLPVAFSSPLDAGTTRKVRPPAAQREFDRLRAHYREARRTSALDRFGPTFSAPRIARRLDR